MSSHSKAVNYKQFESQFKAHHPTLNYQKAKTIYNDLWKQLKIKHDCNFKSHKKSVKDYPDAFHNEVKEYYNQWKLKYEGEKLKNLKIFTGLYKDKNKNKNKSNTNKKRSLSNINIDQNKKKPKTKSKTELLDELISKIAKLKSFKNIRHLYTEGIFHWISSYRQTDEYKEFSSVILNPKLDSLLKDLSKLKKHQSIFHAHIVSSNLFNCSYTTLNLILEESDEYKAIKKDIQSTYDDIITILMKNKEFIHMVKDRNDINGGCLGILFDLYYFISIEQILQSIKLNGFEVNYLNRKTKYRTQTDVCKDINRIDALIFNYGLISCAQNKNRIVQLQKERDELLCELNTKQRMVINSRKYRKSQKKYFRQLEQAHNITIIRDTVGPRRCEERPGNEGLMNILQTMIDEKCLADPTRQSEIAICIKSIPQVKAQLSSLGINISRSSTIRRFEPALKSSNAAKKYHKKTVKATIRRIRNDARKEHKAARHNFAFRRMIKELVSYLGSANAAYVGQDDKDRIKVGTTIILKCKKQILSTEHRNSSSDHNFPVGRNLKLVCSVQKSYEILDVPGSKDCITYRGKTNINLRSAPHDQSTAPAHGIDLIEMINDERFDDYFRNPQTGEIVSVLIAEADGGPDENIRYLKTVLSYLLLQLEFQFDTLIITICVPNWSALNMCERMMCFVNDMITGVEFDPFKFGNPLDSKGKCKEDKKDMFLYNMENVMTLLSNIFNSYENNNEPIICRIQKPPKDPKQRDINFLGQLFKYFGTVKEIYQYLVIHFRPGQFSGQFTNCLQAFGICKYCPKSPRGPYFDINKASNSYPFLPTLVPIYHKNGKLQIVDVSEIANIAPKAYRYANYMECLNFDTKINLCIDEYNPAVSREMKIQRTCLKCGYYSITKGMNTLHRKLNLCVNDIKENEYDEELYDISPLNLFDCIKPTYEITDKTYIVDHKQSSLYLIEYEDKEREWITLNKNHHLVTEYEYKLSLKAENKDENEDNIIPIQDLPAFLHFDYYTNLSDIEEDDTIHHDPFEDDVAFDIEKGKKEGEEKRKKKEKRIQPQLPPVTYQEGYKYYKSSDDSTDDDEPIASIPSKGIYVAADRSKMIVGMIPTLKKKKKK